MWRILHDLLILALFPLAVFAYKSYLDRNIMTVAAHYVPETRGSSVIPAGTPIYAFLLEGVPDAAKRGDKVFAETSEPVVVEGETIIPSKTRLTGRLQDVVHNEQWASVVVVFVAARIDGEEVRIETKPLITSAPVVTDIELLGDVFETIGAAGVAAGIAATSGAEEEIAAGLVGGAIGPSTPKPAGDKQLVLILSRPAKIPA